MNREIPFNVLVAFVLRHAGFSQRNHIIAVQGDEQHQAEQGGISGDVCARRKVLNVISDVS